MDLADMFQRLGITLALGLIVGLQRERTGSVLAGFRTFPLVTILGSLSGLLAWDYDIWIVAAGLVALAAVIGMGNLCQKDTPPGLTTEMALLAMFLLGAFMMHGPIGVGVAIGGSIAVLLHLKEQMHALARGLADPDFKAIMQFVLITLVILPVLPDRAYGPFAVLNPFKIWLMVVLIVGISLAGYIIYKFCGAKVGTIAAGVLGGIISSTATTVSYARRTAQIPNISRLAVFVIMAASTVVFLRVLLILAATAPQFFPVAAPPILVVTFGFLCLTVIEWRGTKKESAPPPPQQENPTELKTALVFAAVYALVLLAVAAAKNYFGSGGLYLVAILSGLTDMAAITLSIGEMANKSEIAPGIGWRLIVTAALSNLVFKGATVAFLGSRELTGRILLLFAISFAFGLAVIFIWPR